MNQSVLAAILRRTAYDFSLGSPVMHPLFIAVAVSIIGLTFWLVWRLGRTHSELALALAVPAALLVYPQSLTNYGVLLILPLLFLWVRREELRVDPFSAVAFITAEYALVSYDAGGITIIATAFMWLLLVVLGFQALGQQPVDLRSVSSARESAHVG